MGVRNFPASDRLPTIAGSLSPGFSVQLVRLVVEGVVQEGPPVLAREGGERFGVGEEGDFADLFGDKGPRGNCFFDGDAGRVDGLVGVGVWVRVAGRFGARISRCAHPVRVRRSGVRWMPASSRVSRMAASKVVSPFSM